MVIVLVICVLFGYFAGERIFAEGHRTPKKQKEYRWFGLEKYWAKEEPEAKKEWWAFWK
jgi:hypothetical protein